MAIVYGGATITQPGAAGFSNETFTQLDEALTSGLAMFRTADLAR